MAEDEVRLRSGSVIPGAWLVRVLSERGAVHHCDECGNRMFVKADSGLCPVCFTGRKLRERELHEIALAEARAAGADLPADDA